MKVSHSGILALPLLSLLFVPGLVQSAAPTPEVGAGRLPAASSGPVLGGCPLFPSDNIWNARVDTLPVHARSGDWVGSIGRSTGFHMDFGSGTWAGGPIGIPVNLVAGSQVPAYTPKFYYPDESDPGPYPIPASPLREWGSDHHVLIVDTETCALYEIYDASFAGGQWYGGAGALWDLNSNALRPEGWTSADAAGLPILPGLVRYDEVATGQINHAIRFTASVTQRAYLWPARHFASSNTNPAVPPLGARFRLKASFDIAGFDPALQVILQAMKSYGIILADNGSNWYVSGAPDERWDNDLLHELDVLTGGDFEAVDASGLMVDPDSGRAAQVGYRDPAITTTARNDFDGDDRSDIGCYDPPGGNWYGFNSAAGFWQTQFGYAGTLPVTGDFDGDGKSDIGCYHPDSGSWYVSRTTAGFWQTQFGYAGTIPIVGDFDGDGRDDIGCYHPDSGSWYVSRSTAGFWQTQFGYAGTIPIVGDFDGDGRDDIGCYHPDSGSWYVSRSTIGFWQTTFGYSGTEPVVGDFDGDGTSDIGCYYPDAGSWYILESTEGFWQTQFGYAGTIPLGGTLRQPTDR